MKKESMNSFWKDRFKNLKTFDSEWLAKVKEDFNVSGRLQAIDGFPCYAVSDDGRVFSCRPCSRTRRDSVIEMKHIKTTYGHRMVRMHDGTKCHLRQVHRLVAFSYLPQPEPHQTVVRHLDGNPDNNHYLNLSWGTQKENAQDCVRHGRTLKGTRNPNAKMNDARVLIVRALLAEGFSQTCIAAFFGVDTETIRRAAKKEQWSHV